MAEVFGIVTGALSVAALFNNCVDCFTYIQLGRQIGRDYQTCQLKLDVARVRLSRWGEAVGVNKRPVFGASSPAEQQIQLARSILEEIIYFFHAAQKTSRRYEMTAKPQHLVVYEKKDLSSVTGSLHDLLNAFAQRRQQGTDLLKKTTWALYDCREFERTVDRISSFIDDLEKLFAVDAVCSQLAGLEIAGLEDERSLEILSEAARRIDWKLLSVAGPKVQTIKSRNSASAVSASNNADVHVGNQYDEIFLRDTTISEQTSNSAELINAKDMARVQVGGRFGVLS